MDRRSAFALQGASGISRQWHMTATDGVEVVSIWEHLIDGDKAETHVHAKYFDDFQPGLEVRAVLQRGAIDPETGNMRTESAEPDDATWSVVSKVVRPLVGKRIKHLHVVKLRRIRRA